MIETEFTREANVDYPIMQGGMLTLSTSELVSSVSEAGCLGILAACTFEGGGELREEIKEVRSKTDQPFGVNITLLPEPGEEENTEEYGMSEDVYFGFIPFYKFTIHPDVICRC